jgi:hypothetical protein
MGRFLSNRVAMFALVGALAVAVTSSHGPALAAPGGVIVSDQGDCSVGPTNVNFLAGGQTAFVWLIFNTLTTVRGYTYEITGTSGTYDSGILKINFQKCRKTNINDWVGSFRTPSTPGGYTLTVFNAKGVKVSSDNFMVN